MPERELGRKVKNQLFPKQLWGFLSSMRAGIFLLLVLAGMSVYGSLMPHEEALEKVYGSWWFVGVLVVMAVNLLACSVKRVKGIWTTAMSMQTNVNVGTLQNSANRDFVPVTGDWQEASHKIKGSLAKRGYRTSLIRNEKGFIVSADKGRLGYFGSLVTHLSIVLILIAGLWGIMGGYELVDGGLPGKFIRVPGEDFSVRIDDFYIAYRDDQTIEQYYSELTVLEGGRAVKQETIYVNKPLRHRGVNFYQSTYGWGVTINLTHELTGRIETAILYPGQTYRHMGTGIHINFVDFLPDLGTTHGGEPVNRSAFPANPHVSYRLIAPEGAAVTHTDYLDPMNKSIELGDGYLLEFDGYQNYTGFLIVKNPGKPLAFFASVCLVLGLLMSFYVFPRRLWAYFGEETNGDILFAGQSSRNRVGFEMEFKRLMKEIKARIGT